MIGSSGSSSNAGAIAGGVVGGVAGLALIAGLVFFYLRHRRAAAQQPAYFATPRQPPLDDTMEQKMTQNAYGPSPIPPFQPQRLYVSCLLCSAVRPVTQNFSRTPPTRALFRPHLQL